MANLKFITQSIFQAKDKHTREFNKMGRGADKFGDRSSRAFKKLNKQAVKSSSIMKGILGAGAVSKGLSLVSRGVTAVTTDFLNFDNAILSASAKFKGLDITTKAGIKTLEDLKKTARIVGRDTEFNAAQAAKGLDFLALAGFDAKQSMALLPGVTNLATVAQVDLATATDIASDSLGAFGLMTKNTEQLTKNFTRVQDVMAKTTATSNTNLTDMFEAVKKGAPDFTAAGQSIETFSALIGTMANAGIKGAEAGTKLRNIAVRLTGGSKEAAAMIESLGINVADSSGNFRDMIDIIDDVIKGTAKMGSVQRSAALKTIFGARQTGGLNVILKEGTANLRSYRQMLIDSKGAAEKMAKIMRSSLMNRLKSLGSAATEVGFQFFAAFDTQAATAIDKMTEKLRKFDASGIITDLKSINKWFSNMSGLTSDIFETLSDIKDLFPDLPKGDLPGFLQPDIPESLVQDVISGRKEFVSGFDLMEHDIENKIKPFLNRVVRKAKLIADRAESDADFKSTPFFKKGFNRDLSGLEELNRQRAELNAPQRPETGINDINLDISGAPEGSKVKQTTKGRANPVNVTGLGRPAALAPP